MQPAPNGIQRLIALEEKFQAKCAEYESRICRLERDNARLKAIARTNRKSIDGTIGSLAGIGILILIFVLFGARRYADGNWEFDLSGETLVELVRVLGTAGVLGAAVPLLGAWLKERQSDLRDDD